MWNFLLISSCSCFFYCFLCCRLSPIPNNSTWYVFFVSIEYIFSSFFRLQEMHTIICIGLFIKKKLFNAIIAPAFEGKLKQAVFFNRLDSLNYANELSTKQERIFHGNDTCKLVNMAHFDDAHNLNHDFFFRCILFFALLKPLRRNTFTLKSILQMKKILITISGVPKIHKTPYKINTFQIIEELRLENLMWTFGIFCLHFQHNMKLYLNSLSCASVWIVRKVRYIK